MRAQEIDYVAAWRRMLEAWTLPPEVIGHGPEAEKGGKGEQEDGWREMAPIFERMTEEALGSAPGPLLSRVFERISGKTTVLDVGAGTGCQTLQLAPRAERVFAVEPSAAMRNYLRGQLQKRGMHNVEIIPEKIEEARIPVVDVLVCANVLYDVQGLVPFIRKLDAHFRDACLIEITFRHPWVEMNEMWWLFHGLRRPERPDYFDALAVLHQMGIYANVQIEYETSSFFYQDLEEAISGFRRRLHLLPDPQRDAKLRAYIRDHSREVQGRIYPGRQRRRVVILWWEKDHERHEAAE
jgi:SAM-dependent methyltransferase